MKRDYLIITALSFLLLAFAGCGSRSQSEKESKESAPTLFENADHQAFFDNLALLCGKSFRGEQVYRSHHGESWAERAMIMYVTVCEADHIHIPFHIDDDRSRTWMFTAEEGRLVFRHQHLHEDGTHEESSMYGGYADDRGNALVQYFPADEHSAGVIEDGGGNVWTVSVDAEKFSYRLDRDGEKRLEIVFDLTAPLTTGSN